MAVPSSAQASLLAGPEDIAVLALDGLETALDDAEQGAGWSRQAASFVAERDAAVSPGQAEARFRRGHTCTPRS